MKSHRSQTLSCTLGLQWRREGKRGRAAPGDTFSRGNTKLFVHIFVPLNNPLEAFFIIFLVVGVNDGQKFFCSCNCSFRVDALMCYNCKNCTAGATTFPLITCPLPGHTHCRRQKVYKYNRTQSKIEMILYIKIMHGRMIRPTVQQNLLGRHS